LLGWCAAVGLELQLSERGQRGSSSAAEW
jgi:hypothetical protein